MSANYLKWINKPEKSGSPQAAEGGRRKRQRSVVAGEGSTAGEAQQVVHVEDDPPHTAVPPPVQPVYGDAIFLAPGELWTTGVSDRLRAVIRPPPVFVQNSPLGSDLIADLGRAEEETLKAASLIQSLKELHLSYESSSSSYAAVSARAKELQKEKSELQLKLDGVADLEKKLKKAEDDLVSAQTSLTEKYEVIAGKNAALAEKHTALGKFQEDLNEAREMISKAAIEAFTNALEQINVLHPGLDTEGADVFCLVKDGRIVSAIPGHDDGEGEGSDHGEDVE